MSSYDFFNKELNKVHPVKGLIYCDHLRGMTLKGDYRGVDFVGVDFTGAQLVDADFQGVSFFKSNFTKVRVNRANFQKANLSLIDATEAIFEKVDFTGSKFYFSNFQGAYLGEHINHQNAFQYTDLSVRRQDPPEPMLSELPVVAVDAQGAEEASLPVISAAPVVLVSGENLDSFWSGVEVSLEEWKNHLAASDEQSLFYLFMGIWTKLLKDLREALGPEPLPFSVKILGLSGERLFPENLIEYAFDWVAGQNPQDTLAMEAYLGRFNEVLLKAVEKLNHLETSVSCKFYMGFASRNLVHATLPREKQEQYYRELAEQSEMLVDRLSLVDYVYAHTAFSSEGTVLEQHPVPPFRILELSKWIHELSQALPMRDLDRMAFYLSRVWSMGERLLRDLKDSGHRYGFLRYQMKVSLDELYHAWWGKERSRDSSSLLACVKQQIADWDHYWKQLEQALAEKHQDLASPMLEAS